MRLPQLSIAGRVALTTSLISILSLISALVVAAVIFTATSSVSKTNQLTLQFLHKLKNTALLSQYNLLAQKSLRDGNLATEDDSLQQFSEIERKLLALTKQGYAQYRYETLQKIVHNTHELRTRRTQQRQIKKQFAHKLSEAKQQLDSLYYRSQLYFDTSLTHNISYLSNTLQPLPLAVKPETVDGIRLEFAQQLRTVLRAAYNTPLEELQAAFSADLDKLYEAGLGPENLFTLRRRLLALQQDIEQLYTDNLSRTHTLRQEMLTRYQSDQKQASLFIQSTNHWMYAGTSIAVTIALITSLSVILIGGRYFRAGILKRLDVLTTELMSLSEGQLTHPITQAGHDEITQLSQAVEGFRLNALELLNRERELAQEKRKLEAILSTVPNGVVFSDLQGHLLLSNEQGRSVWRYLHPATSSESILVGVFMKDGKTPYPIHELPVRRAIKNKEGATIELMIFTQNEQAPQTYTITSRVVYTNTSTPLGVVSSLVNITEYEQQRQELETLNKDLRQFSYISTHDLREPARQIATFSQLLNQEIKPYSSQKVEKYFGYILDGAQRMTLLLDDLLDYAQAGVKDLEREVVNLTPLVKHIKTQLESTLKDKQVEVIIEGTPTLTADKDLMYKVLSSLISNGVKYNDNSPIIRIGVATDATGWTLSVKDNGIGIEAHHTQRIFEVFKRLHDRKTYSGTGMGLSICERIARRHGGLIWVESHPGQGSTFYMRIPCFHSVSSEFKPSKKR